MSVRRVAVLAVAGMLVGVLAWYLTQVGGSDSASTAGGTSSTSQVGSSSPGGMASAEPSGAPARTPEPTATQRSHEAHQSSSGQGSGQGNGAAPSTSKTQSGSEILPSPSSAASPHTGLPGLKPPHSTTAPLVTAPLPRQATGTGVLVAGYPAVLAPPARHTIAVSSVSPGGSVLQVALTASCRRPCDPLRHYRTRLDARGFAEVSVPSVENQPVASLQRDRDSVTVTITGSTATTIDYVVFAVLHAARV